MHQSWEEYWIQGWGVDPDLMRERMGAMFNPYDELFDPADPGNYRDHPLDFDCQCKFCVQKTTISMQDRKFLWSIRVVWNKRDIHSHRDEREAVSKYDEREIWRAPQAEDLRSF